MKTTRQYFKPLFFVCYLVLTCWTFNGQNQNQNLITPDGINGNWWTGSALHSIDNTGLTLPVPTTTAQALNTTHISPANIHEATYSLDHNNFVSTMTFTFNTSQNIDGMVLWQPCGAHIGGDAPFSKIEIVSEKCGIVTRDTLTMGLPSEYSKRFNFTPKYGITSITLNIIETWVDDDVNATSCDDNTTWTSTDINSNFDQLYNYSLGEIKFTEALFTGDDVDCEAGAYCCEGENLVENGNFEFGDIGFTSAYTQTTATYPGEYDVTTNANAFGATVNDHSFCTDPTQYPNNSFLVVNGKTQQSGSSTIWEQTLQGLEDGEEYKFCANFKDMEQCTFNIFPNITMSVGNNTVTQVIDTDDTDACDWYNIEICFIAEGDVMNFKIELDETGNGDGNDLAIDDIAVMKKLDPNYFITIQHQGDTNAITGSLNTIANTDDILLNEECEFDYQSDPNPYYWFVYVPNDPNDPLGVNVNWLTFGWGNTVNSGGNNTVPWDLTTTFPTYTFSQNTFYVIGMWIPSCCESCYTESWEYQITYNNGLMPINNEGFSDKMKAEIKSRFVKGNSINTRGVKDNKIKNNSLSLYPNPAQDSFTISINEDKLKTIKVLSITGKTVFEKQLGEGIKEEIIDVSTLSTGIYFVNVIGENQKQYTAKLIKE